MIYKDEFIERLAKRDYTKKDAATIVQDVLGTITEIMAEGESVMFRGFGTFEVRSRAERESISPSTKERIIIPAYKAPHFTAGKLLKKAVTEGKVEEVVED